MSNNQQYEIGAHVWVIRGNSVEVGQVASFDGRHYRVAIQGGTAIESFHQNDVFDRERTACQFAILRLETVIKSLQEQKASCWIG